MVHQTMETKFKAKQLRQDPIILSVYSITDLLNKNYVCIPKLSVFTLKLSLWTNITLMLTLDFRTFTIAKATSPKPYKF